MRSVLLAAAPLATTAVLAFGGQAHATAIVDPAGDFLPSFVGAHDADLDVLAFSVAYDNVAQAFNFHATLAGEIDPARAGVYVIGANTGTGTIRPFGGIGAPNVIFNQAIVVQKSGAAAVSGNNLSATISGASFSLAVPLAFLPSTGFAPTEYGFNLWPRNGLGNNNQISDFAPDNANITGVPEPGAWALMILGFGAAGLGLRRRRHLWAASPV